MSLLDTSIFFHLPPTGSGSRQRSGLARTNTGDRRRLSKDIIDLSASEDEEGGILELSATRATESIIEEGEAAPAPAEKKSAKGRLRN